jgi:hypothetical protein
LNERKNARITPSTKPRDIAANGAIRAVGDTGIAGNSCCIGKSCTADRRPPAGNIHPPPRATREAQQACRTVRELLGESVAGFSC